MKRFFSAVLVLCVCLSLIIMPGSAEEQQTQIDTIRIAIQKEMGTFAPFNSSPNKSWDILSLVYDNLYEMDTHRVLQPSLATSYEISEDYTTYTFYLRDDVTWHDGGGLYLRRRKVHPGNGRQHGQQRQLYRPGQDHPGDCHSR